MSEWISVKDKVPRKGQTVIVFQDYYAVEIQRYLGNLDGLPEWDKPCAGNPTHWMPLPEPPKESI